MWRVQEKTLFWQYDYVTVSGVVGVGGIGQCNAYTDALIPISAKWDNRQRQKPLQFRRICDIIKESG